MSDVYQFFRQHREAGTLDADSLLNASGVADQILRLLDEHKAAEQAHALRILVQVEEEDVHQRPLQAMIRLRDLSAFFQQSTTLRFNTLLPALKQISAMTVNEEGRIPPIGQALDDLDVLTDFNTALTALYLRAALVLADQQGIDRIRDMDKSIKIASRFLLPTLVRIQRHFDLISSRPDWPVYRQREAVAKFYDHVKAFTRRCLNFLLQHRIAPKMFQQLARDAFDEGIIGGKIDAQDLDDRGWTHFSPEDAKYAITETTPLPWEKEDSDDNKDEDFTDAGDDDDAMDVSSKVNS